MTDGVIDLNWERAKREEPDANCVKKDQFGRDMFLFALEYEFDGSRWCAEVWAYDWADAEARVAGMKDSLVVVGQTYGVIPG